MESTISEFLGSETSLLSEGIVLVVKSGLHLWHLCLFLRPLSLLDWKMETRSDGFCCLGLEIVCDVIQNFIQLHINLDHLVVLFGFAHLEDIVLAHHVAEEIGVQGVDHVEDELSVTLSDWIVREVLFQKVVTLYNLCKIFLGGVLICRDIDLLDLGSVEGFAFAFHNLNEKFRCGHALGRQTQLS